MKKIGIMQPYFLPYIGYFQLMKMVDEFVIYDNIQFTKKGWIHRNRMLQQGKDEYFTLPLKKDSDYLNVNQRFLAETFMADKTKLINRIQNNYKKAPYFQEAFPVIQSVFEYDNTNLFDFIYHSILRIREYLDIDTPITISSNIGVDHDLKGKDKVLALVKALKGTHYINPIGGQTLYNPSEFQEKGIELYFFKTDNFTYLQFKNDFIPFLSILDVMMFNDRDQVQGFLGKFDFVYE